jgi:squalene cyclase
LDTDTTALLRRLTAATAAVLEHPSYTSCIQEAYAALNEGLAYLNQVDATGRRDEPADEWHGPSAGQGALRLQAVL